MVVLACVYSLLRMFELPANVSLRDTTAAAAAVNVKEANKHTSTAAAVVYYYLFI